MTFARILSATGRAIASLAAGAATAALLMTAWVAGPRYWAERFAGGPPASHGGSYLLPTDLLVSVTVSLTLFWSGVAAIVAAPSWLLLIRIGRNGIVSAIGLGALLAEGASLAASLPNLTAPAPTSAFMFGLIGAVSGAVAWTVTKGRIW